LLFVALGFAAFGATKGFAQESDLNKGPAPPPAEAPAAAPAPASGAAPAPTAAPPAPEAPKPQFDPLKAHKDIEIGNYYLKLGNFDAALDRFQEATTLQPGLAEPFRLLGRTYEKMHRPQKAVESYRRYLNVFPNAPDHEEIQKQIDKISDQLQHEARK
jgi:tetratricopeptide (TPR) repeat protein